MRAMGSHRRTIWPAADGVAVEVIDQRALPHDWRTLALRSAGDAVVAIRDMVVRGAPLIGVTAAYGIALQARADAGDAALRRAAKALIAARPTAVNLAWAVDRALRTLMPLAPADRAEAAWALAGAMADEDVAVNRAIGRHGLSLLQAVAARRGGRVDLLTHCNAGWLATVDWGTALAPVYAAQAEGIEVHVWVDETRPRNQGASLTAWELAQQGVAHTVIADNAGGHLMQHGRVDLVVVGTDRVGARGDVCNKIGTYLKALAARDNGIPFHVAMPLSTLDLSIGDALAEIPIEERAAREQTHVVGRAADGSLVEVQLVPDGSPAANPAFDVTPARLVSGLITEHGCVPAEEGALRALAARAAAGGAPR
ncbi:MAG: S-methyl-5-thioribose-1-phosphate isomerase [Burkholderiaceae bacterium]|nr:S-methyl-5-thioribose-1-phosphate isomerase [Burkholderiaceae bacterium]